jgi:hypothetical protein
MLEEEWRARPPSPDRAQGRAAGATHRDVPS